MVAWPVERSEASQINQHKIGYIDEIQKENSQIGEKRQKMAGPEGFEPSTSRLRAGRSTILSYGPQLAMSASG